VSAPHARGRPDGGHRLLVVVGTRPEAIKMAPVVRALREYTPDVETQVVFTGQHTTLVDSVLDVLELEPDYDLGIMREGQTLYDVMHAALDGLRDVVRDARPDLILVQGDTTTVFVASLVGFFEGVGVGHVEAGLRSGNKRAPFPEEVLRRLTDVIADVHFAPTANARDLLLGENVPPEHVYVTGNTVVDALLQVSAREHPIEDPTLRTVLGAPSRRLVLLTAHRRESFGAPLRAVFEAVRSLADELDDIDIVYPVHPNPEVRGPAHDLLGGHARIHLVDPLSYVDLVAALRAASLVLTDSGGIQEEAPTFGVPVLVLRAVTERPEGLTAGVAEVVGTDPDRILDRARAALGPRDRSAPPKNPYGDGAAAARIADILVARLTGQPRRTLDWDG
jgi:UDP-N-acetylglucosamine 2-epimerase (non-hydrolysing)